MERLVKSPINRRWAKARGMVPWEGHREGAKTLDNFLDWCFDLGVPNVSVYICSTENLNRPKKELKELFEIFYEWFDKYDRKEFGFFDKYQVKVRFVGELNRLPKKLVKLMGRLMQKTAKYQKKCLNFLVAYGSKYEMIEVFKKIAERILKTGKIEITEKDVDTNLMVPVPLDIVIRTGGYSRLSNFLLWQASYAELITLDRLWPDFTKKDLVWCIKEFNRKKRNFGK